jgi:hypothetical protein
MLRIPLCLGNRFFFFWFYMVYTIFLYLWSVFVTPEFLKYLLCWGKNFCASGTHFCYTLSKPQGLVQPERLGTLKKLHSVTLRMFSRSVLDSALRNSFQSVGSGSRPQFLLGFQTVKVPII